MMSQDAPLESLSTPARKGRHISGQVTRSENRRMLRIKQVFGRTDRVVPGAVLRRTR